MKKYQDGGGIREGKARFGDDIRERARKAIAEQMAKAENKSKFGGKEPVTVAKKVTPPQKIKSTPLAETASEKARRAPRPEPKKPAPKPAPKPEKKASQFGPPTTFPRDVGAGEAAKARQESFAKQGPFGDLMDLIRGKKNDGAVKKMANGGSVSKRADGIAQRGKTKGRMI
jgi:hypothetical protein